MLVAMVDLHTHSTASDGQYTPPALVHKAAQEGVSVLALTDHDTVAGLDEAASAAKEAGITFVRGVELNIQWPSGEFHLLGLGLQRISHELEGIINELQDARRDRNSAIIAKIQEAGIPVSMEAIERLYPGQTLGRPHIAGYLVEQHVVKTRQQAFDRYLAKGRPWYVNRTGAMLDEAVYAIKSSGGVPVIAHPLSLYISWGKIGPVLQDVYNRGVQGLEAWHSGVRVTDALRLEGLARKTGFFVTAGSDFHGEAVRADRRLGHTAGGRKIDDRFWEQELQPAL